MFPAHLARTPPRTTATRVVRAEAKAKEEGGDWRRYGKQGCANTEQRQALRVRHRPAVVASYAAGERAVNLKLQAQQ